MVDLDISADWSQGERLIVAALLVARLTDRYRYLEWGYIQRRLGILKDVLVAKETILELMRDEIFADLEYRDTQEKKGVVEEE